MTAKTHLARSAMHSGLPLLVALALGACAQERDRVAGVPANIDYNWHVRPILSEYCFKCHGPDPEGLEAGLRLDTRETAIAELPEWAGHYAIVPGSPESSELIARVSADDPEERMPPASTHKSLTDREIEILRRWEYDANEDAVAEEEGMQSEQPLILRRVVLALEQLTGGDEGSRSPTKADGA